jgi:hypothetical protein
MDKVEILKLVAQFIISSAVGTVIGNAIKMTTPIQITTINKVAVGVGAFVISNVVGDIVADHAIEMVEKNVTEIKENFDKLLPKKEELGSEKDTTEK